MSRSRFFLGLSFIAALTGLGPNADAFRKIHH